MYPYHVDGRGSPPRDPYARQPVSRTRFKHFDGELVVLGILLIPIYISAVFGWLFGSLFLNDEPPDRQDPP